MSLSIHFPIQSSILKGCHEYLMKANGAKFSSEFSRTQICVKLSRSFQNTGEGCPHTDSEESVQAVVKATEALMLGQRVEAWFLALLLY